MRVYVIVLLLFMHIWIRVQGYKSFVLRNELQYVSLTQPASITIRYVFKIETEHYHLEFVSKLIAYFFLFDRKDVECCNPSILCVFDSYLFYEQHWKYHISRTLNELKKRTECLKIQLSHICYIQKNKNDPKSKFKYQSKLKQDCQVQHDPNIKLHKEIKVYQILLQPFENMRKNTSQICNTQDAEIFALKLMLLGPRREINHCKLTTIQFNNT